MPKKLGKRCKTCHVLIDDRSKTGYCQKHVGSHRDHSKVKSVKEIWAEKYGEQEAEKMWAEANEKRRNTLIEFWDDPQKRQEQSQKYSGDNNPMFGKSVQDVWLEKYGEEESAQREIGWKSNIGESSKNLWKSEDYRDKVVQGATGKKRSEEFSKKQSMNAKIQMQDPHQRQLRSENMKRLYREGILVPNNSGSPYSSTTGFFSGTFYASNQEKKRMEFFEQNEIDWKRYVVSDFDFRFLYEYGGESHMYLPDFILNISGSTIVEEVKYDVKYISDKERAKIECGKKVCLQHDLVFRVVDRKNMFEV